MKRKFQLLVFIYLNLSVSSFAQTQILTISSPPLDLEKYKSLSINLNPIAQHHNYLDVNDIPGYILIKTSFNNNITCPNFFTDFKQIHLYGKYVFHLKKWVVILTKFDSNYNLIQLFLKRFR